jgi:uncharacterized protein (TIGR02266 family)
MHGDYDFQGMITQMNRAREALGEALGQTQEIGQVGLDLENLNRSLAGAVRELFLGESEGLSDASHVAAAMDHLRDTLVAMQEVPVREPVEALDAATATVARTMAILFPVQRALLAAPVPGGAEEPIPLSIGARDGATPLRLTRKSVAPTAPAARGMERRGGERRSIEADIGFQSETNFFTGFSMDISSGGLFVATFDIPPVGTVTNVNFRIPDGPMMSLDGVVRWVREYNDTSPETAPGMGVMFERLSPAEEDAINTYLARSSPLFFEP